MVDTTPEEIMDATAAEIVEDTTTAAPIDGVPAAEAENPGLSLNDIRGCVSIIDIVTKRGAFEGPEMADVGAVRNRLAAFLQSAEAAANPTEAEAPTE